MVTTTYSATIKTSTIMELARVYGTQYNIGIRVSKQREDEVGFRKK